MSLEIKEIPVPKDDHPESPNIILPKHEFTMGIIAPKGAGKTTLMINLLEYYKGYFHTIVIFSPSIKNDPKWEWVKQRPYLTENVKLKKFLRKIAEKHKKKVHEVVGPLPGGMEMELDDAMEMGIVDGQKGGKDFDPKIPEEFFIEEYSQEALKEILDEQNAMVNQIEDHGGNKYLANRLLIILDDLVGSDAFKRNRKNPFIMANTNHRHLSLSMLQVVQAYKEFPTTVRRNWTCIVFFKNFNQHEIDAVLEEYSLGVVDKKERYEIYEYCTKEPHSFLYFNVQREPMYRLMRKFEEYLFVGEDDGIRD